MTPPNSSPSFLDKHFVGPLAVPVVGPERSSAAVPNSPSQISKKTAGRHTGENIRVDKSHAPRDERIPNADQTESTSDQLVKDLIGREGWLRLHATDLIRRLQDWASGLDAREATLNASYARQDIRERKFRLHQQEIERQIAAHKQAAEDLRQRINASLRKLVFCDTES